MRLAATPFAFLAIAAAAGGGCTCGNKSSQRPPEPAVSSSAASASSAAAPANQTDGVRFSAPIGAARVASGVAVAGLVVPNKTITLVSLNPDGTQAWTSDVLRDVAWTNDAELTVYRAGDGAAVVWRGLREGKSGRYLVVTGPRGEPRAAPIDIGATPCATTDGLAWVEHRNNDPFRVRELAWTATEPKEVGTVPPERDPTLVCGDRGLFVFADGEDDLTLSTAASLDARAGAPVVAMDDRDFGEEEEREHDVYAHADDVGLLRVGGSGVMRLRETRKGVLLPWRKLTHKLATDDDVVAVDADSTTLVIVYSHDESDRCADGASAESVHALRVDRASGEEARLKLAAAECGKELSGFWVATPSPSPVVAWLERGKRTDSTSAPIRALMHRAIAGGATEATRVAQPADALVDGGCDTASNSGACYAVALVREPGTDGMTPEPLRLLRFP
jgi:hypothetical protein